MLRIIFSLLLFIGVLACLGYGALWLVDHKNKIAFSQEKNTKPSLSSILENTNEEIKKELEQQKQTADTLGDVSESSQKDSTETTSQIHKSSLTVTVLNGGGANGSAGKTANLLLAQGYTKVKASNAQSYHHKGVTVYFSKNKQFDAENIRDIIKKTYSSTSLSEASGTEQSQSDIVIIIGE